MGLKVLDLRPDIFQMVCGYFSFFVNRYLFPMGFRHELAQSTGMMGTVWCWWCDKGPKKILT